MQKFSWILILLPLFIFLTGCVQQEQVKVIDEVAGICPLPLPATYAASIPCQSCLPTTASLTLRPDSLYFLKVSRIDPQTGSEDIRAEIGVWKYVATENSIVLATYDNVARTLVINGLNSLRVVRVTGGIIPPDVNYDLILTDTPPENSDVVRVRGMYSYMTDAGQFSECLSGAVFPVAMQDENAALERAYMNTPHAQAEPLLVTFEASLALNVGKKEYGDKESIVPVRFIDIQPGIECNGRKSAKLRLVDNYWRLIELNGKAINLKEGKKNPFFHLATRDNQIQGFAGCNRFVGSYLARGEMFLFSNMSGSRMACVQGMELEDAFFHMLSQSKGYRIKESILELLDQDGNTLARLKFAGGI